MLKDKATEIAEEESYLTSQTSKKPCREPFSDYLTDLLATAETACSPPKTALGSSASGASSHREGFDDYRWVRFPLGNRHRLIVSSSEGWDNCYVIQYRQGPDNWRGIKWCSRKDGVAHAVRTLLGDDGYEEYRGEIDALRI